MSSKIHTPAEIAEEEILLERIRQFRIEEENGTLIHVTNETELRDFFASLRDDEA